MIQVNETRKKQLSYIGISDDDLLLLKKHKEHFEQIADIVVDLLYDNISKQPQLTAIINAHSSIDRLKQTQKWYFLSMTDGTIDEEYIEKRLYIGKLHSKIGLTSDWYLGTYMVYLDIAVQNLKRVVPD